MPVKVKIPKPLQRLTKGKEEVDIEPGTVISLIDKLEKKYPGIKERITTEDGKLARFVTFYVNDEDIRFLQNERTEVNDGDEFSIVPAIAGG